MVSQNKTLAYQVVFLALILSKPTFSFARWTTPLEADYSYLLTKTEIYIPADGRAKSKSHIKIKVLNEKGRSTMGTLTFSYTPDSAEMAISDAYVRNEGKRVAVPKTNIVDKPIRGAELGFDDLRQIMVSFPMVQVGSEIEYISKRKVTYPTIENAYASKFDFGSDGLDVQIDYELKSEKKLYLEVNDPDDSLSVVQKMDGKKYFYSIRNKKPIFHRVFDETESIVREDQTTWVKVSTVPTYKNMFHGIAEKYELKINDPLPEPLVEKLTSLKSESDTIQKIAKTLAYLSGKIRYMGDWRSVQGALIPRDLKKITETQSGDCKDMSILTTKLLRELGIKAWVALVYRGDNPPENTEVPYFSFNHAIVMVDLSGKRLWLDPTNFQSYPEGIFEDIAGRTAVVLNPENVRLEEIAFLPMQKNHEVVTFTKEILNARVMRNSIQIHQTGLFALPITGAHLQYSQKQFEESTIANISGRNEVLKHKISLPDLSSRIVVPFSMSFEWETPIVPDMTTMGPAFNIYPPQKISDLIKIDAKKRVSTFRLGSPDISEISILYKNIRTRGRQIKNCSAESPWVDYLFSISYSPLKVDMKLFKKKFEISPSEIQSNEFLNFQKKLKNCGSDKYLVYSAP